MKQYDIAVIGGGPAGLQATLVLARTRKKIIVFDAPQSPRNGASHGVHNFLGIDGLRPHEIRDLAWKQIDVYQSAELCEEKVENVTKGEDGCFYVTGEDGTSISAKHVILTSGYRDVFPDVQGFKDCWANTIINCPFCDGYENRDRVWGIVATTEEIAHHFPTMLRNWTPHIKLLLQEGVTIDDDFQKQLTVTGVDVHSGAITQVHHTNGKVEGVTLESGEKVDIGTLLWIPEKQPIALIQRLVDNLGLEVDANGFVTTNNFQQTNVDGLWAAGDVQNAFSGALDSASTGMMVALMIIKDWHE